MFRLAHISDVHLGPLPPIRMTQLMSKRVIGYVNWHRSRKDAASADRLQHLVADLNTHAPDHIAVTGDLVNIGLPDEIDHARSWLTGLGAPDHVTVIPGNHDAYVGESAHHYLQAWQPFMCGDQAMQTQVAAGTGTATAAPVSFPFVRRRGPVALIALSTALATPPFMATGTMGRAQGEKLSACLREARDDGLVRIVLIHHPPLPKTLRHCTRRMTDAALFRDIIARDGADLVLHGHDHVRSLTMIDGPGHKVPVIGVPAAAGPAGHANNNVAGKHAGYALHEIALDDAVFKITTIHRSSANGGPFNESQRLEFTQPRVRD